MKSPAHGFEEDTSLSLGDSAHLIACSSILTLSFPIMNAKIANFKYVESVLSIMLKILKL